jgi:hypothetical protein
LPGTGQALAEGRLDPARARMIVEETDVLNDPGQLAAAEAMILAGLDECPTWAALQRLVARAVCTVDPEGARKRREHAQRETARVAFWREASGAATLAGYSLPTDEALAANASIEARAQEYRTAGIKERIDILRVLAFLDLLNAVPAPDRVARWKAEKAAPAANASPWADVAPADRAASEGESSDDEPGDGTDEGDPGSRPDGGPGVGPGHNGGGGGSNPRAPAPGGPALPALVNLTLPLATQMGLADRPGEAWGLGALDPALARRLAEAAARSAHSRFCVTIVNEHGHAIAHGCCKRVRSKAAPGPAPPEAPGIATFTPSGRPGPPGGYGSWTLTLPGAATSFTIDLFAVPVGECDHRYESPGHDPSDRLRHLTQVRDGKCSFPTCSRHARETDFEHGVPFENGGRTCACNCHSCSRSCHQVKQQPGWTVTQEKPGWHTWTTPSGRTYTQGPWQYPA